MLGIEKPPWKMGGKMQKVKKSGKQLKFYEICRFKKRM